MNDKIKYLKEELERKYDKTSNKKVFEDKFLKLISEHSDGKQEEDEADILQEFFDSYYYEGDDIHVNNYNKSIVIYLDSHSRVKDKNTPYLKIQRYKNYYKLTSGYLVASNIIFTHVNEIKTFAKDYFKSFQLKYVKK